MSVYVHVAGQVCGYVGMYYIHVAHTKNIIQQILHYLNNINFL